MRVCVLYCRNSANDFKSGKAAAALAKGLEKNGNSVDVICMNTDRGKIISYYDYVSIVVSPVSYWGGKISNDVQLFLKSAGSVSGLRCSCFVFGSCIRKQKTVQLLMKTVEAEGMFLRRSDYVSKIDDFTVIGCNLKTVRDK